MTQEKDQKKSDAFDKTLATLAENKQLAFLGIVPVSVACAIGLSMLQSHWENDPTSPDPAAAAREVQDLQGRITRYNDFAETYNYHGRIGAVQRTHLQEEAGNRQDLLQTLINTETARDAALEQARPLLRDIETRIHLSENLSVKDALTLSRSVMLAEGADLSRPMLMMTDYSGCRARVMDAPGYVRSDAAADQVAQCMGDKNSAFFLTSIALSFGIVACGIGLSNAAGPLLRHRQRKAAEKEEQAAKEAQATREKAGALDHDVKVKLPGFTAKS